MKILPTRLSILLAAALAVAAILAGCGGGSGNGGSASGGTTATTASAEGGGESSEGGGAGTGGGTKSRASGDEAEGAEAEGAEAEAESAALPGRQFVKQANAACTRITEGVGEEVLAYEEEHAGEKEEVKGELNAKAIVATLLPTIAKQTEEIKSLAAERGEEEAIAPYVEDLEGAAESAGAESEAHPGSLQQVVSAFKSADELARRYGLVACLVT